jgi:hypothetical protein
MVLLEKPVKAGIRGQGSVLKTRQSASTLAWPEPGIGAAKLSRLTVRAFELITDN